MMNLLEFSIACADIQAMQRLDVDLLQELPCYFYMKDKRGKYIGVNQFLVRDTGFNTHDDLLGISDFDLCKEKTAASLTGNDRIVMANKNSVTFVEPITFINEKKVTSISYKSPLRSRNGKILGVIGLSIVQYEKQAHDVTRFLKSGLKIPSLIKGVTITNREKDILNLLACGHTARKIAETLSLSPRTVEHHIENIKNKTGAANKAELIQMLIKESGS